MAIMTKYHANGMQDDPLVNWEYAEIVETLKMEMEGHKTRYVSPTSLYLMPCDAHLRSTLSKPQATEGACSSLSPPRLEETGWATELSPSA